MKYVWKGPAGPVEIWPEPQEGKAADAPLFSGFAETDKPLADLPETHPTVRSWIAFGLIEPAPAEPVVASRRSAAQEAANV